MIAFDGKLFVGGTFTAIGGVAANNIAIYNGVEWSAIGSGMNDVVNTFEVYDNKLIVGGDFTLAGDTPAARIATWDGSTWSTLGTGLDDDLTSMTVSEGQLIVNGRFHAAGATNAYGIASWDGTSWHALSLYAVDYASDIIVYDGRIVLTGGEGGPSRGYDIDGTGLSWFRMGHGTALRVLETYNGVLIAGGDGFLDDNHAGIGISGIAAWDGSSWTSLPAGTDGVVSAFGSFDGNLVAAGSFMTIDGVHCDGIATWDGVSWQPLYPPHGYNTGYGP